MDELVSVIIPVFNGEKYISQAINSVLQQTYSHFEIIVINDGSTDLTGEILSKEQSKDLRIKVLDQINQGSAAARNKGIDMAQGKYIVLLDADDLMLTERIEKQMQFLKTNPQLAAVSCLAYYINDRNEIIGRNYSDLNTPEVARQYLKAGKIIFCLQSGVLIKKEVMTELGGYRNDFLYGQDTELWNRLVEHGFSLVVMPDILVKYRIHPHSSMTHFKKRFEYADWLVQNIHLRRQGFPELSFQEFIENLKTLPWHKKLRRKIDNHGVHFYRTAGLMFAEKKFDKFLYYLVLSLLLKPAYTVRKLHRQHLKISHSFNGE